MTLSDTAVVFKNLPSTSLSPFAGLDKGPMFNSLHAGGVDMIVPHDNHWTATEACHKQLNVSSCAAGIPASFG